MTAKDAGVAFEGHWEQRGMVKVPVMPDDPYKVFDFGPEVTVTSRPVKDTDHVPSHAGFLAHVMAGATPCDECEVAERMYQHNRRNL